MANGLQRAAQAPPPAELDDVFVIAITALSTAAPDVLRCGISNRRMSAWGQNRRYRIPTWESALTSNSGR